MDKLNDELDIEFPEETWNNLKDNDKENVKKYIMTKMDYLNDCRELLIMAEENNLDKTVFDEMYETFSDYQKLVYDVATENWERIASNNNGEPSVNETTQYNEDYIIKKSPLADRAVEIKDFGMVAWIITDEHILWLMNFDIMVLAIKFGHKDMIEFLRNPNNPWGSYDWPITGLVTAILNHDLNFVKWLCDPNTTNGPCPNHAAACSAAARKGDLETLKFLRNSGTGSGRCGWTFHACTEAATNRHIEVFKYLRDPEQGGGVCPMMKGTKVVKEYYDYTDEHGQELNLVPIYKIMGPIS